MSASYEIDFLPTGTDGRSGDAICMRYGSPGNYRVLVYDGGTEDAGMALVRHIREHYCTEVIDDVVCSHPDPDHVAGLSVVLENMTVLSLWMHRPWIYSTVVRQYVQGRKMANEPMPADLQAMAATYALEVLAARKRVRVREPFQGKVLGEFTVLSPNWDWYIEGLMAKFERPQESEEFQIVSEGLTQEFAQSVRQASRNTAESWDMEALREDACTSFEDDSSVVLFGMPADRGVLLTGDAGVRTLTDAIAFAKTRCISLRQVLKFMQIPRHGSRHNVSPAVLDQLIGPKIAALSTKERITAFASTARHSTYPNKAVANAFMRRGAKVIATNGMHMCHSFNMDTRTGWKAVPPL